MIKPKTNSEPEDDVVDSKASYFGTTGTNSIFGSHPIRFFSLGYDHVTQDFLNTIRQNFRGQMFLCMLHNQREHTVPT